MAVRFVLVLLLAALTGLSHQASKPDDPFYIAGVVEFSPAGTKQSSLDMVNDNLRGYLDILLSPEAEKTDIIVFPEWTLNNDLQMTFVPDPEHTVVPCNNSVYHPFLQELSCAAKSVKKYVVVNVAEKETCTVASQENKKDPRPCALNGLSTFNTNVAFDRNGAVVARYRKYNIYGEVRNITYQPQLSTFTTDFGVKFGMFICFDINYYSPAMDLVKSGVKDLIFSTFWFSELPFLTAVQVQQGWAYANNVNLLAAGASYPAAGSTGTGIYAGEQGALVSVMSVTPERKLYVANVTKMSNSSKETVKSKAVPEKRVISTRRNLNGFKLMTDYKMPGYTTMPLVVKGDDKVSERVCNGNICCSFYLEVSRQTPRNGTQSYQYQMAAFEGDRQFSGEGYSRYKLCGIYACTNSSSVSCGTVFDDSVDVSPEYLFKHITIETRFPRVDQMLIMPNSLDQNLYPLPVGPGEFVPHYDKEISVMYVYPNETSDLLTFGIYATYYNSKAPLQLVSWAALVLSLLVVGSFRMCLM